MGAGFGEGGETPQTGVWPPELPPSLRWTESSVGLQQEEPIGLHDTYKENKEYAGLIVRRGHAAGVARGGTGCTGEDRKLGPASGWVMAFSARRSLPALSLL